MCGRGSGGGGVMEQRLDWTFDRPARERKSVKSQVPGHGREEKDALLGTSQAKRAQAGHQRAMVGQISGGDWGSRVSLATLRAAGTTP